MIRSKNWKEHWPKSDLSTHHLFGLNHIPEESKSNLLFKKKFKKEPSSNRPSPWVTGPTWHSELGGREFQTNYFRLNSSFKALSVQIVKELRQKIIGSLLFKFVNRSNTSEHSYTSNKLFWNMVCTFGLFKTSFHPIRTKPTRNQSKINPKPTPVSCQNLKCL